MPLYTPPDSDDLPLRLGVVVRRPDTTTHQPDKRAVKGKPHLFVHADGRMSYEPPTPPTRPVADIFRGYRLMGEDVDPVELINAWRKNNGDVIKVWQSDWEDFMHRREAARLLDNWYSNMEPLR